MKRHSSSMFATMFAMTALACGGGDNAATQTADAGGENPCAANPCAGMDMPDWFTVDAATKTATIDIAAGSTDANNHWNFNGYYNGDATIIVPEGYTVTLNFKNDDPLNAHSIGVDAMLSDFRLFGGRTVIRELSAERDLMSLGETLIVNCTGLGSRDLFRDQEMTPIKGQLTLLAPQDGVDYSTFGGLRTTSAEPGIGLHMMPRRDGIALGGTAERGEWSMEPNEEARERVVEGHAKLYNAMRAPWRTRQ